MEVYIELADDSGRAANSFRRFTEHANADLLTRDCSQATCKKILARTHFLGEVVGGLAWMEISSYFTFG